MREFKIAHMYGNLLNTYGDNGNLLMLKYCARKKGFKVTSEVISLGDDFKAEDYDLVFIGGGQDLEQEVVSADIMAKKDSLQRYIEDGGVTVGICGGYQLLGEYYVNAQNKKIPGTGILKLRTETQDNNRFIGNITIHNEEFDETYSGFENHNGMTYILDDKIKPLGTVIEGHGNNGFDKSEGIHYKNVFCSYLHGPPLVRNPHLAERIIDIAIERMEK